VRARFGTNGKSVTKEKRKKERFFPKSFKG
jgi:hypothetical protein